MSGRRHGLVETIPPDVILRAVVEVGCSRWHPLGLKLLSGNDGAVRSCTHNKSEDTDKLNALICKRVAADGAERVAEDVMLACQQISDPIYADVLQKALDLLSSS